MRVYKDRTNLEPNDFTLSPRVGLWLSQGCLRGTRTRRSGERP